jgi:hypothetical protein
MVLEWKSGYDLISSIHDDAQARRWPAVNVGSNLALEVIFVDHAGTPVRVDPAMAALYRLIDQSAQAILCDPGLKFAGAWRRAVRPMAFHDVTERSFCQNDFISRPVWLIRPRRRLVTDQQE